MNKYQEFLSTKIDTIKMKMDKKYILTIAITVLFAGLIGFYSGRYYEVKITRQRFAQMRNGAQGQQFQRGQGQGMMGIPGGQGRFQH